MVWPDGEIKRNAAGHGYEVFMYVQKARVLYLIGIKSRGRGRLSDSEVCNPAAMPAVKKKRSELFYDWPQNMGFDVPYIDSMEGM